MYVLITWIYYLFAMIFVILFYPLIKMQIRKARTEINKAIIKETEQSGVVPGRNPALDICFIGDSIIEGRGLVNSSDTLPVKIAEALQIYCKQEIRWQRFGNHLLSSQSAREYIEANQIPENEELYLFVFGMNDVFELTPVWKYRGHILALIQKMKEQKGDIVFSGILPMEKYSGLSFPLNLAAGLYGRSFDAVLSSLSGDNIFYLPAPMPQRRHFTVDGFHPDRIGNSRWGEFAGRQISKMLKLRLPV